MRALFFSLALSICWSSQETTAATVMVFGEGLARDCYLRAEANDANGISICDRALTETALAPRERAATLINRGAIKFQTGDLLGSLSDTENSLHCFGDLPVAYLNRGAALISLGSFKEAIASLSKAIELGLSRREFAYYDRALAKEHIGDVFGAYNDYKKALDFAPGFQPAADQIKRFRRTELG